MSCYVMCVVTEGSKTSHQLPDAADHARCGVHVVQHPGRGGGVRLREASQRWVQRWLLRVQDQLLQVW